MDDGLRLKTVVVSAVGGQGGNLLVEWLFHAASLEGHRAQAISLPGLSQRGGATSFYLEIATARDSSLLPRVVFSQHPVATEVDVVVAQEFLELARILQQGYGSDRTRIIASTHRVFTVGEKAAMWEGEVPEARLHEIARTFSGELVGFDAVELARRHGLDELAVNAILLGALAASRALPIQEGTYQKAVARVGAAPETNLQAFEIGREFVASGLHQVERPSAEEPYDAVVRAQASHLAPRLRAAHEELALALPARYGARLARVLSEAIWRLLDYQDRRYAEQYLQEVAALHALDHSLGGEGRGLRLTETFAKSLATWMAYEDAIRVAELKTRPERFRAIRERLGLRAGQVYEVYDFLKPDAEEIYGILPARLVDPLLRLAARTRWGPRLTGRGDERWHFPQKPKTSALRGFLRLRLLTLWKPLRPVSWRYRKEHAAIAEYIARVKEFAAVDYEVGCLVARAGQMVKGYGETRRRTLAATRRFLDQVVAPLVRFDQERPEERFALTRQVAALARKAMAADEHGIDRAEALTRQVLERARDNSYQDLLAHAERGRV